MVGSPAPDATKVLPAGNILQHAWEHRPAWALVPFEALEPRWKVLEIDDQSSVRKDFNEEAYPLTVPFSLKGDPQVLAALGGGNQSLHPFDANVQPPIRPPDNCCSNWCHRIGARYGFHHAPEWHYVPSPGYW